MRANPLYRVNMKLAIAHPFLRLRGGAEKVVLKVAQHFNAKVYCSIYEPEKTFQEFKDVDIEVMESRLWSLASLLPMRIGTAAVAGQQFYRKKLEDYDAVNAQGTPSEWIRNKNCPVIWYCFSPNREAFDLYEWRMSRRGIFQRALYWSFIQPYRSIEFSVVPKIEHIFAISGNVRERIKKYLGRNSEILMPGVDYQEFHAGSFRKYFFYPSRIAPEKNFEMAIEAFKKFKKEKGGSWKLIIAGSLDSERMEHVSYYRKIKRMIAGYGEIRLNVPEAELKKLYSECFSALFTPFNEDFGLIPLEAMSSYKPCIAINQAGPSEIVKDGENGFLVNSPTEMAIRMQTLAENPALAEEMGKKGRKYVEKNFNWNDFLERLGKVCESEAKRFRG